MHGTTRVGVDADMMLAGCPQRLEDVADVEPCRGDHHVGVKIQHPAVVRGARRTGERAIEHKISTVPPRVQQL